MGLSYDWNKSQSTPWKCLTLHVQRHSKIGATSSLYDNVFYCEVLLILSMFQVKQLIRSLQWYYFFGERYSKKIATVVLMSSYSLYIFGYFFFGKTWNHPSASLQSKFGIWDFPKARIIFERKEVSDHNKVVADGYSKR